LKNAVSKITEKLRIFHSIEAGGLAFLICSLIVSSIKKPDLAN
jgi:hypothetical protein